jgi:hypothetical protein
VLLAIEARAPSCQRGCAIKWFKHDADASNDAKLRKLRLKYGAQGYGIYWYCLELIARNVEKHNLTFELEHDALLIADDFKLSSEIVQEMMAYMVNLGLFENTNGVITCIKMSTRTDEYTQKLIKTINSCRDNVGILSAETPRKSVLREEKRREENIKEKKMQTPVWLPPIPKNLLDDYLEVRKAKKVGRLTETAFKQIEREARIAGITTIQAIEVCCARGWAGFKADWYLKDASQNVDDAKSRILNGLL